MTAYMKIAVANPENISKLESAFLETVKILAPIGKDVFRGSNNVFSTSLYDCVTIGISKYLARYSKERTDVIIKKIEELKASDNFKKASGSASASKSRIMKRIEVADEIFGK